MIAEFLFQPVYFLPPLRVPPASEFSILPIDIEADTVFHDSARAQNMLRCRFWRRAELVFALRHVTPYDEAAA